MSAIVEKPIRPYVVLETYQPNANPFVLGAGRLGSTRLQPAGTPIAWTDWTDNVMNIDLRRGGKVSDIAHRNEVGTLSATLRDVAIDIDNPEFIPGQKIRLVHIDGANRHTLFTGDIQEIDMHQLRIRSGRQPVSVLQLVATDAIRTHNETQRYGAMPEAGTETLSARIERLSRTALGPLATPSEEIPGALGRTVYESSISNHLNIAGNTVGAWWYVDGDGVVQFQRRAVPQPAPASLVTFVERREEYPGNPWPAGVLHLLRYTSSRGSRVMYNGLDYANHGAQIDPDEAGTWIADDETFRGVRRGSSIARYGIRVATIETNYPDNPGGQDDNLLLSAYGGDTILIESVTWNAQEDITRIPDIDLGAYIELPLIGDMSTAPWRLYIVGGIHHTITPTRWLVELSLIGVTHAL